MGGKTTTLKQRRKTRPNLMGVGNEKDLTEPSTSLRGRVLGGKKGNSKIRQSLRE